MSKQVRFAQAALAGAALATLSIAHVDDPKGRTPHITYMGPGWCASGCGNDDGGIASGPAINFLSSGVQLLAWLPCPQFDLNGAQNSSANTVEGWVSPGGREYAIIGLSDGTGFVDVGNPSSPVIKSFIRCAPTPDSLWRDVRVYQNYCYTVSEGGGGIQVINMTNLDTTGATLVGNVTTDGPIPTTATHTVFINPDSGILYRAGGGNNGLRIYRLSGGNQAAPVYLGAWTSHYVHEVTVVSYTSGPYVGREIAFACTGNDGSVHVLDVTNLTDTDPLTTGITELSVFTYAGANYCHQGWLSPDRQHFYINDELDNNPQTRIFNISNLAAPVFAGVFSAASSIDHNLYTKGNVIFESNYRSGLRIFDATNPTSPTQAGYFDTWPEDDAQSFNGLWDNYPYLPSGIVLGADIEKGLFIWSVGTNLLNFSYPNGQPDFIAPNGGAINVNITSNGATLDPATAKFGYSINGAAFTEAPLQSLGGSAFRANFPSMPCGAGIRWYVLANTTTGMTLRDPPGAPFNYVPATAAIGVALGQEDTLETNSGWVVGNTGDNATTGIWLRANPVGTAAQPEDDHTPAPGVNCFITGNGAPGGMVGDQDVDGGVTTLTSAAFDATGGTNPNVTYYRWYSNNAGSAPNEDSMPVQISSDGGTNWVQLELVTENAGAWVKKSFRIADFVPVTSQVKLRFLARDLGNGSVVEAGVDDVRIEFLQCAVPGDVNNDGHVDVNDLLAVIAAWGPCPAPPSACPADIVTNGVVDVNDLLAVTSNWGA